MDALKRTFFRPPFIGLLAVLIVFITQGFGHTVMIMMENLLGHEWMYHTAIGLGVIGLIMLWYGMRHPAEGVATWWGFFAAILLWTGWVEFSFVAYANQLGVQPALDAAGEVATKPEYLIMESTLGVLLATLVYFILNKETKCNMFRWIQRNFRLNMGKPNPKHERNFAAITFMETLYIVWFFYVLLLVLYNEAILGDRHPVVYGYFFLNTIWALYLFLRLIKMWKVGTAIRYAIPTGIIGWNSYELLGRWDMSGEDIWVQPERYWLQLLIILAAIAIVTAIAVLTPDHIKARLDREARGLPEPGES